MLQEDGVKVPLTCRAQNALQFLDSLTPETIYAHREDLAFHRKVGAYHRLAWELFLIVYAADFNKRPDTPFLRAKVAEILRGPDFIEGRDSHARDIQFELAMAAQFRLGGVGVHAGEPDLLIDYGTELVGIAAKRIRSLRDDTLDQRLDSAIDQINRSGHRGFIALNVDQRFAKLELSSNRLANRHMLQDIFESVTRYRGAAVHANVLGVMVFGYTTRLVIASEAAEPSSLRASAPFRLERWVDDDSGEARRFEAFATSWRDRLNANIGYLIGKDIV
jgi:hypothetical protein